MQGAEGPKRDRGEKSPSPEQEELSDTPSRIEERRRWLARATVQGGADFAQQPATVPEKNEERPQPPESVISSTPPEYTGGISGLKSEYQVVMEKPSDRAQDLANEIQDAWRKSRINAKGMRIVLSKKDKKEKTWGEYLSTLNDRMQKLQDKERAYVRANLPMVSRGAPDSPSSVHSAEVSPEVGVGSPLQSSYNQSQQETPTSSHGTLQEIARRLDMLEKQLSTRPAADILRDLKAELARLDEI